MAAAKSDSNTLARRVCISQELGQRADWVHARDTLKFSIDLERGLKLNHLAGEIASCVTAGPEADPTRLRTQLVRLAGEAQAWVERIDADTAR